MNPPARVVEVRHTSDYVHSGVGDKASRKIFYCVPYTDFEEEQIKRFEAVMRQNNISFPEEYSWLT